MWLLVVGVQNVLEDSMKHTMLFNNSSGPNRRWMERIVMIRGRGEEGVRWEEYPPVLL